MDISKYFYDKQIRRYLLQVSRIFSGYQVRDGYTTVNGQKAMKFKTVPVAHANINRLSASYLSDNSENVLVHSPAMAFYISDLQPLVEFRNMQHTTTTTRFTEKERGQNGEYINVPGKKYDVSQVAPTPFDMKITLDIWTSSMEQKLEIIEQILVYFNPGFEFRVNSSRFDIAQTSNIELESIQWSSRGVPIGSGTELEFSTLVFRVFPVYISAPAKITRQNIIKNIAVNSTTTNELSSIDEIFANSPTHNIYVTPDGYNLNISKEYIDSEKIQIARLTTLDSDTFHSWNDMFKMYGVDNSESCLIRIRQTDDIEDDNYDVYAKVTINKDDDTIALLEYDIDTFKPNTLAPINYIISGNNTNIDLYNSEVGVRILVASDMDSSINNVWDIDVVANSIIEKTDNGWVIVFNTTTAETDQYVIHTKNGEQYKFAANSKIWFPTMVGEYREGFWSFDIQKVIKK